MPMNAIRATPPRLKQIPGASGKQTLVLDQHRDGPPSVQRLAIVDADGVIIRDPTAIKAEWRDPADTQAMTKTAGKIGAKYISGWRRVWTIDSLAKSSPAEFTEPLVKAATRFLNDWEQRSGAAQSGGLNGRVDGGADGPGRVDAQIEAGKRVDAAKVAVGGNAFIVLGMAVVENWKLTRIAEVHGITRDKASALVWAALLRLREHYDGQRRVPVREVEVASGPDVASERLGRWKDTA